MRRLLVVTAFAVAGAARTGVAQAPVPARPSTPSAGLAPACADTAAVIERAVAYVALLGQELGAVVASEDYRQEVVGAPELPQYTPPPITITPGIQVQPATPMTARAAITRRLRSAFLFVPFSEEQAWVGYRQVLELDGRRVDGTQGTPALQVAGESGLDRWRRLSEESARYNIGTVTRTVNVPTFALLVLHPSNRPRFSFSPVRHAKPNASTCEVAFQETDRPTLIRNGVGGDVPASGMFRIDAASGRVEQSELIAGSTSTGVALKATVRYERDGRLQHWVPREMREEYVAQSGERLVCVARYSDYRRAEVTAKVRPPM